jgi:hypothetical protein
MNSPQSIAMSWTMSWLTSAPNSRSSVWGSTSSRISKVSVPVSCLVFYHLAQAFHRAPTEMGNEDYEVQCRRVRAIGCFAVRWSKPAHVSLSRPPSTRAAAVLTVCPATAGRASSLGWTTAVPLSARPYKRRWTESLVTFSLWNG